MLLSYKIHKSLQGSPSEVILEGGEYKWSSYHRNGRLLLVQKQQAVGAKEGGQESKEANGRLSCCFSVSKSCPTVCDPMDCSTPGFPVLHYLLEFAQTQVHWVSDAIQPSDPLSSPYPATFNLSQHQGLFQWISSLHQVAKVLELPLQHQSFQWIFRVISFRIGSFDFLSLQGTLKNLLQHHSSRASILWHSAFCMDWLSYLHMTAGKTIALADNPPAIWLIRIFENGLQWIL